MTEELKIAIAKAINGPFELVPDSSHYTLQELRNARWRKHGGIQKRFLLNSAASVIQFLADNGVDVEQLAKKVAGHG